MARVFISHASEDRALADEVHQWLAEAGHEVFLAQDLRDGIAVGQEWEQRLHEELRLADAVVCVLTSAFLASRWCTAEIAIARSRGSWLLPIQAEPDVADPMLKSVQHTDYTRDPATARAALVEALRQVDTGWPDDRPPFPGLQPFEVDQHRVFFGRTDDVGQLAELLRSPAERAKGAALLVVGPSGCGKSSLVRAGLVPMMASEPDWRTLPPIVPGAHPVAALARELATAARQSGLDWTVNHVHHQLDAGGLTGLADELLLAAPGGPRQRLLIVVDQFEELLTQTDPTERTRFAELLHPALAGPVQVVATMRPEFLDELLLDPGLAVLPTHTYTLRPLRREALRAVIEKPAQLAGIDVDDGLVDRLIDDTDSGEALPLLAFTLAQLADGVTRGGRLSSTRYDRLGGVQGALIRQADAALNDAVTAGGRSHDKVIAGLLRLVTVDEQGRPTRWRVNRNELPDPVVAELDAFVARRLLTTDTDNGTAVIGVAHEAFLSAWPPLAEAIAANVSALRARRAVEHAATEWHDNNRQPARLWGSGQLAAAMTDIGARLRADTAPKHGTLRWLPRRNRTLAADRVDPSPKARDFLHASIRRDRHRRRRATTVLSVLLILALIGAGIAVDRQRDAQDQRLAAETQQRIATGRQLIAQAELARDTDPRTALQLGIAAQHIYPSGESQSSLVNTLATTRYAGTITDQTDGTVAFALDGRTLATSSGEGAVILWDLSDPAQPHRLGQTLTGHSVPVEWMEFTLDRHTLVTGSGDGAVILWDLSDPAQPRRLGQPLTGLTGRLDSMAFTPDGHTLATASQDGTTILWDLSDPAQARRLGQPLSGHAGTVSSVAFASDGQTLATGSYDNTAILWDLTDLAQPRRLGQPLAGHTGPVSSVAFTPDGHTLATGSYDNTTILWDLSDPAQPRRLGQPLSGHAKSVSAVTFAPDGHTLATASEDNAVILWDLTDPAQPRRLGQPLNGHTNTVLSVAFAPDGRTLATGSYDNTAILWNLSNPAQPRRLSQPLTDELNSMAFAPDGHTLATGSQNGTTILWDLSEPAQPRRLGQPFTGSPVVFASNGRTLATDDGNAVTLWDLSNPDQPRRIGEPLIVNYIEVPSVAFAPNGLSMAAGSGDAVTLWDLSEPDQPRHIGQPLNGDAGSVSSMAFTPDGHTLAIGSDTTVVTLWDLSEPDQPRILGQPLIGHEGRVSAMAFTPDGQTLATVGGDGTVILWGLTDLEQPRILGLPTSTFEGRVSDVELTSDGRTLAIRGTDSPVALWDLTDPAQPRMLGQPLADHNNLVSSVALAPKGNILAINNLDGSTTLWDLTDLNDIRTNAAKKACFITGEGFDRNEWASHLPDIPYKETCPARQ